MEMMDGLVDLLERFRERKFSKYRGNLQIRLKLAASKESNYRFLPVGQVHRNIYMFDSPNVSR